MAHALFSASASSRWIACNGSLALSKGVPPSPTSLAAFTGTAGHELADQCVKAGTNPEDFRKVTFEDDGKMHTVELSQEFVNGIQKYVDYVRDIPGELFSEMRVYYGAALGLADKLAFGTSDILVYDKETQTLYIVDLKTGRFFVDSLDNTQMLLYGAGGIDFIEGILGLPVRRISMTIIQPFVHHDPAPWVISRKEFEKKMVEVKYYALRAELAMRDFPKMKEAEFVGYYVKPGEKQCKFCPAVTRCPALRDVVERNTQAAQDSEFEVIVKKMTPDELARKLDETPLMEIYVKAVREEAMVRLLGAQQVPGKKLVAGRQGDRKFKDERLARRKFKRQGWDPLVFMNPPTLKTPSQIETALKRDKEAKEIISSLVTRAPGKPTIVDASHHGEPWSGGMQDEEFDVIS